MFRACSFSFADARFESSSKAAACASRENGATGSPEPGPPEVAPNPYPASQGSVNDGATYRVKDRENKMQKIIRVQTELKRFLCDQDGAITIEWVILTAGVIALGIAAYGAFKIDREDSFAYLIFSADGSETHVSAVNGLQALVAQTKLNTMKFVMCNFKSANFVSETSIGDFNACQ